MSSLTIFKVRCDERRPMQRPCEWLWPALAALSTWPWNWSGDWPSTPWTSGWDTTTESLRRHPWADRHVLILDAVLHRLRTGLGHMSMVDFCFYRVSQRYWTPCTRPWRSCSWIVRPSVAHRRDMPTAHDGLSRTRKGAHGLQWLRLTAHIDPDQACGASLGRPSARPSWGRRADSSPLLIRMVRCNGSLP